MNAVVKQQKTPEEYFDAWVQRRVVFPCYIRIEEKHFNSVFLINNKEELIETAFLTLKRRFNDGYYGDKSWYFNGTFDAYVEKKTGVKLEELEALLNDPKYAGLKLNKRDDLDLERLKRAWSDELFALTQLKDIIRIVRGEVPKLFAVQPLLDRSRDGAQYEKFEIEKFDIPF